MILFDTFDTFFNKTNIDYCMFSFSIYIFLILKFLWDSFGDWTTTPPRFVVTTPHPTTSRLVLASSRPESPPHFDLWRLLFIEGDNMTTEFVEKNLVLHYRRKFVRLQDRKVQHQVDKIIKEQITDCKNVMPCRPLKINSLNLTHSFLVIRNLL